MLLAEELLASKRRGFCRLWFVTDMLYQIIINVITFQHVKCVRVFVCVRAMYYR